MEIITGYALRNTTTRRFYVRNLTTDQFGFPLDEDIRPNGNTFITAACILQGTSLYQVGGKFLEENTLKNLKELKITGEVACPLRKQDLEVVPFELEINLHVG